jgi:hypothetical protein
MNININIKGSAWKVMQDWSLLITCLSLLKVNNCLNGKLQDKRLDYSKASRYAASSSADTAYMWCTTKGQLISEWLLDVFIWTKKMNENIFVFLILPYLSKIGQIKKECKLLY